MALLKPSVSLTVAVSTVPSGYGSLPPLAATLTVPALFATRVPIMVFGVWPASVRLMRKVVSAVPLDGSSANSLMSTYACPPGGLPLRVCVPGFQTSQLGSGSPLASVGVSVRVPPSASLKTWLRSMPFCTCVSVWSSSAEATVGAWLVSATVSTKVSCAERLPSLALTRML